MKMNKLTYMESLKNKYYQLVKIMNILIYLEKQKNKHYPIFKILFN